jgi:hypothetical protein
VILAIGVRFKSQNITFDWVLQERQGAGTTYRPQE